MQEDEEEDEEEEEEDRQSNTDDVSRGHCQLCLSVFNINLSVPVLWFLNDSLLQDEDYCEEWERHEALHEDVTSQERSKERLFEEEIELKWEKGGSGLVFYTDAQYWQEEEGGITPKTSNVLVTI